MDQSQIQQAKARMGIIGNAPGLLQAVGRALRVAPIDLAVLVTGESGAGKEFFPRLIHAYSPRKHSRYIAVNCGAIPEGTIDSELFGHEKGAFTGAIATRKGYFEEADGGTIFLDEVAELPLTTQARLLRVLETGEFIKVGSSTVQRTNIRVVAATNTDMEEAVRQGRFREDLFYRLSTIQISVPPLRERGEDIALLARKFASELGERYRTEAIRLDGEALEALRRYRWPGNVRQLKNVMEQLAVFEAGEEVSASTVLKYLPGGAESYTPVVRGSRALHSYEQEREALFGIIFRLQREIEQLREQVNGGSATNVSPTPTVGSALAKYTPVTPFVEATESREATEAEARSVGGDAPVITETADNVEGGALLSIQATEREAILRALRRHEGHRRAAAMELGISERTLYRRIKDFGLDADDADSREDDVIHTTSTTQEP